MNLQVGVKVLLRNPEGNYLILKRSLEKYGNLSGCWDIVGGRIDPGTELIDNLRREVMEEIQLEITSVPILIAAQDIIPNTGQHVVRLTYTAETIGTPILDMVEHTEYRWVTSEELREEPDLDRYVRELLNTHLLI